MALILCVAFMALSFFSLIEGAGVACALFLILSAIAFMQHSGGSGSGPDDQRMA